MKLVPGLQGVGMHQGRAGPVLLFLWPQGREWQGTKGRRGQGQGMALVPVTLQSGSTLSLAAPLGRGTDSEASKPRGTLLPLELGRGHASCHAADDGRVRAGAEEVSR